jgi:hypothetical protein
MAEAAGFTAERADSTEADLPGFMGADSIVMDFTTAGLAAIDFTIAGFSSVDRSSIHLGAIIPTTATMITANLIQRRSGITVPILQAITLM